MQTAPDQGSKTEGSEPYAGAWLDHGTKPDGATYEYAMVIGADAGTMSRFAAAMLRRRGLAPYTVLRRDHVAHVVHDRATKITGHAVFAASDHLTDAVVRAVDTPSVILVRADKDQLVVSVTDPDLRLYTGPDRFDPEVSPFGVPWRDSPSRPSRITVSLAGRWAGGSTRATAKAGADTTELVVECRDGLITELRLRPA